ncbi:YeeE/YedE family protein [Litorivicinus lipolyticus]|uniref:YeeE/YedE family protein n=1 Tax=Litorivicinus lipolyticus TaxID=418701 RepID=A0A5Q2QGM9_9GAMM|nr:YeeE/YedE thiosulfate transporter family protein [Litorivicinus lipolyticus]QGG81147.1 YeeE/YedE family protein [Litorivicinus lipolyticus]
MTEFTPGLSALGGAIIGLSAALGFVGLGKVTGVSGIVGRALGGDFGFGRWGLMFLIGLIAAPLLIMASGWVDHGFDAAPSWAIVVAGLMVGWGTRMGSGCTSGHGICGISRFSIRSIVATLTFVGSGVVTVFVVKHLMGVSL